MAAFEMSMKIHRDILQDEVSAATAQTSMAMAHLASGDTEQALSVTAEVERTQGLAGDPVVRAGNFLVQGWARFSRGELARAYGNANYALTQLHSAAAVQSQPCSLPACTLWLPLFSTVPAIKVQQQNVSSML